MLVAFAVSSWDARSLRHRGECPKEGVGVSARVNSLIGPSPDHHPSSEDHLDFLVMRISAAGWDGRQSKYRPPRLRAAGNPNEQSIVMRRVPRDKEKSPAMTNDTSRHI